MKDELKSKCESCIETKCGGHAVRSMCSCPCHSTPTKEEKNCKDGGTYRGDDGYLVLTCEFCLRDMEDGEIRKCMGKCENECDYQEPYGFVPEAGCEIHDKPILPTTLEGILAEFEEEFPELWGSNDGREGYDSDVKNDVKSFIRSHFTALVEEKKEMLEALLMMYQQYCREGHLFMSAGENASSILEKHRIATFDDAGFLQIISDMKNK